jgi:hypothetical protein
MTRKKFVSTIAMLGFMMGGAAFLSLSPNTDRPLAFAQNEPPAGQEPGGGVTERSVPVHGAHQAGLLNACSKQPGCRQQLDAAQQGQKPAPRRAAKTASPEDMQRNRMPPPLANLPAPSTTGLLDACSKQPGCRQQLDAVQQGQKPTPRPAAPPPATLPTPHGEILPTDPLVFSLFNLFGPAIAHAQTPFSVVLTPSNPSVASGQLYIHYGSHMSDGRHLIQGFVNNIPSGYTEGHPYVMLQFYAPSTAWYLIDIQGSNVGNGTVAKMRHLHDGPIIATWDFSTLPSNPCDYVTVQYLQAGFQHFYFWLSGNGYTFVNQVSVQSVQQTSTLSPQLEPLNRPRK